MNALHNREFNFSTVILVTATETEYKMKRGLLLNILIGERATVFKLLASEDESLLVRRALLQKPFGVWLDYTLSYFKAARPLINNRKPSSL